MRRLGSLLVLRLLDDVVDEEVGLVDERLYHLGRLSEVVGGVAPDGDRSQLLVVLRYGLLDLDLCARRLPDRVDVAARPPDDARHVRGADGHVLQEGRATVMANRLPPSGARCTAHLVSVESQYVQTGSAFVHWSAAAAKTPDTVRLVSLAHWSFVAETSHGDLSEKLKAVTPRPLARDGAAPLGFLRRVVHSGGTVLRHNATTGRVTPTVYHGPLVATVLHDSATIGAMLPARHPRDLRMEDPDTGLPDISYAAAWELGRLLALRDNDVAVPLHDWKRRVTHDTRAQAQGDAMPEVSTQRRPPEVFPLRGWFTRALARLGDVPFCYIVPDPQAVPPESLSFAQVDVGWIAALMDGAFSIGRTNRAQVAQDANFLRRGVLPDITAASAVILRSAVVSGWPDLVFEAHDGARPVATVTHARLDRDTLILLFAETINRLDVHLHPQAIHFGVDTRSGDAVHKTDAAHVSRPFVMRDAARGVLPIAEMAATLAPGAGSGVFARHMIEGVPKVTFNIWMTV